jgi:molybdopterin/thiamine biosynthesis adenylyltransferase
VTACTFNIIPDEEESSVFNYYDTNSSRANINLLNNKLKGQKIAIIGIGGTGGYLLDLLSKTPVSEIHLFDGDNFLQHNSFRAPGTASVDCFDDDKKTKVNYFADIYSNMHKGIFRHSYYFTEDNLHELDAFTFVFICVDKSKVRKMVIEYLLTKGITFIDVGLGVNVIDGAITGLIRTTLGTPQKFDHLDKRIPSNDDDNGEYHTNVQIAELNMYNAVQAVMKWKQFLGFLHDTLHEHDSCFIIDQYRYPY